MWVLIPAWGKSSGGGNGNPLQYSCLVNSTDGDAWWATVHGVAKSRARLHMYACTQSPGELIKNTHASTPPSEFLIQWVLDGA